MALYFKDIEITNIDNLVPQSGLDITDIWFGSTNTYTVWSTYEGTLPATINANGDNMKQYQVYGAAGGVGDRTVNLFDISSAEPNKYINPNNGEVSTTLYNDYVLSDYIYVAGYNVVTISSMTGAIAKQTGAHTNCYDDSKNWIRGYLAYNATPANTQKKFVVDVTDISYIRVDFATADLSQNMLTPGTTPPETFVPFGYELDIGVSDGTSTTTTPIYIGDAPLDKDEYVDYQAGKIYRMSGGTLTPTDPPVPLPALPTCEGTTIVDYLGQSVAPEKVLLKYRKEGF